MTGTTGLSPDMGPGPFITDAALVSMAFLVMVVVAAILAGVTCAVLAVRDRRRRRLAAEADLPRYSKEEVEAHLDCLATNDPQVSAALARLDAAVRGQQPGGEGV